MKLSQRLVVLLLVSSTSQAVADDVGVGCDVAEDNECHDLTAALQLPTTVLTSRPSLAAASVDAAVSSGKLSALELAVEESQPIPSYQLLEQRAQELLTQRVANPATSFAAALTGMPEADIQGKFAEARQEWTMIVVVTAVLVWITALLYRTCGDNKFVAADGGREDAMEDFKQWNSGQGSNGPCDCFQRPGVCIWACCCPCIRWADTMSSVGILGFWLGLWLFFGLVMLGVITSNILVTLFMIAILTTYRQQLRTKFSMEDGGAGAIIGDCCLYCFCLPCTIAQEARHVDAAAARGHAAVGDAVRAKA